MVHIGKAGEISRRAFMRRSGQLAMMGAASGYALGLAGLSDAAAFASGDGYKALVCVFLLGGNDHANTLIPFDAANYARYSAIRGGLPANGGIAIDRAALTGQVLSPLEEQTLTDDMQLALAPTMPRLKSRFDQGAMAPLLNVGPLIVPLTRAQFESENITSFPRPAKLFSHNDQQSTWQSGRPEGSTSGWGGRIGDLAASSNTNSMFTAINATGNAVFLSGDEVQPYGIAPAGAIEIGALGRNFYGSGAASDALRSLITAQGNHVFAADYATMNARSIQYSGFINDAISGVNLATDFGSGNSLASQLQIVARLIAGRNQLGVKRQVFLVATGGFDNHDGLIGTHEGLLAGVDFALDAFYRAMVEIGVADRVTTFTASDFGRTLSSNGDGSDHGWGSHHFVLGGAVRGGQFYGTAPTISVEDDGQVGQGRLLPTTSVDQYSATLAKWFGVSDAEIPLVSPNIGNFDEPDLGFMKEEAAQAG
ncbi:DUF1501 domain-containing protein [Erythrobacter sp.]|uniref:DUF1501 domain-containing protein n=1 Tax=Erythrobacter sp. TaxID=1042 RepID=UPI001425C304|nr:DUF1501 domain-containing protein [Erythrobacter sp.]QIQ85261.1 MAG: DUF1501 domain-containing protein [Erythrobacter sp.]